LALIIFGRFGCYFFWLSVTDNCNDRLFEERTDMICYILCVPGMCRYPKDSKYSKV